MHHVDKKREKHFLIIQCLSNLNINPHIKKLIKQQYENKAPIVVFFIFEK